MPPGSFYNTPIPGLYLDQLGADPRREPGPECLLYAFLFIYSLSSPPTHPPPVDTSMPDHQGWEPLEYIQVIAPPSGQVAVSSCHNMEKGGDASGL